MKKNIITCLLCLAAMPALACIWWGADNNYMFSLYNRQCFRERTQQLSDKNWLSYLGSKEEYFWFDAKELTAKAKAKGDVLMMSYIKNLQLYLDCARDGQSDQWDYPTKQQLAARHSTLNQVATYAYSKLNTRLRSQHALLYMRCNMMLGRHAVNISFWENRASQYINSVYKEMMLDIYAGALTKTNRRNEGCTIFASLGDWESLMTVYYELRSFEAIKQEYQRDPNSAVLPFLVQDFVNNSQEAADQLIKRDYDVSMIDGKLFVRKITEDEAQRMCAFATEVVSEGKTRNPAMWQSAKAWINYLFGHHSQAAADIDRAVTMEGEERMRDNAKALQYYITAAQMQPGDAFDAYIIEAITWYKNKEAEEQRRYPGGDGHYLDACHRLLAQVAKPRYKAAGERIALMGLNSLSYSPSDNVSPQYYDIEALSDTEYLSATDIIDIVNHIKAPTTSRIEQWLNKQLVLNDTVVYDLIGTQYMRQCQWQKALEWLQRVPLSFYEKKGCSVYAANRSWELEPWMVRQWLGMYITYEPNCKLTSNYKIDFCREMLSKEAQLQLLTGTAHQQMCYDLAVRYAQADFTGDCWYIMRYAKSYTDTLRPCDADLKAKARALLHEAANSKDKQLRQKALYALSYVYLNDDCWYTQQWNDATYDYHRLPQRDTRQWSAWAALADYNATNGTPAYISRCDEYRQFLKAYHK